VKVGDIVKRTWVTMAPRRREIAMGRCESEHGMVLEVHPEVGHVKLLCAGTVLEARITQWKVMNESA
jgi:hypothetical protein